MLISNAEIMLRLLLATALGFVFGLEREYSHKPAGTRTHVLICLAACLVSLLSAYGFSDSLEYYPEYVNINIDPARLVVGMLTGIGFIGAGIIWKSASGGVQGITTAAEVFLLATFGIALGMGQYLMVGAAAVIAMATMKGDDILSKWRNRKAKQKAEQAVEQAVEQAEQAVEQAEEATEQEVQDAVYEDEVRRRSRRGQRTRTPGS